MLVSRVRVGSQEELDVTHTLGEAVQSGLFVAEQRVGGDDDFPLGVPGTAADQAGVGEFRRHGAVEIRRIIHGAEGLVFSHDPELLAEAAFRREELT